MQGVIRFNNDYIKELHKLYCSAHNIDLCYDKKDINKYNPDDGGKIRLLRINDSIKGYVFFSVPTGGMFKDRINIDDIYIEKYYNRFSNYKLLLESTKMNLIFKKYKYAQIFFDERNKKLQEIIPILDLILDRKLFEMRIQLDCGFRVIKASKISFSTFRKGIDEKKRMAVQNSIFKDSKWHKDSSIKDIFYEEGQDYFIEDGCIFLEYGNETVGYSQIILEKNLNVKPCIVNFGICKDFRGLGLSKLLLNYTLNTIKYKGFAEAYINVDVSNYRAYNLYKKAGFEKVNSFSSYLYKYK